MSDIELLIIQDKKSINEFGNFLNKNIKEKIQIVEKVLKLNNTREKYLLEYLKLKQENKDKDFNECLRTYEVGINEENFKKVFGNNTVIIKLSAYQKIINLFNMLKMIEGKNGNDKILKIIEILDLKNEKYKQTFPIFYTNNKELFFNSLLYRFIKSIKDYYENETIKIKKDDAINLMKQYADKKLILQLSNDVNKKIKIKYINEIINHIDLLLTIDFNDYINNLSIFINSIYDNFIIKFENNDIFKCKEYDEKKQKNDINLFQDFMFFLSKFNFLNQAQLYFYTTVWQETFCPIPLNNLNVNGNNYNMKIDKNDLKFVINGKENIIKNINNYSSKLIDILKCEISLYNKIPDLYELDKYLKFDKYDSNVFIKTHWNILKEYISEILCSNTIKSIYKEIHKKEIIIYDKNQIIKILDNFHFFNYETDCIVETKKRFLFTYVESQLQGNYPQNINLIKLTYLTVFLITCIHEIIGHLFLRIFNYLSENEKLNSPMPLYPSDYAKFRGKESGEKIEELLFGNYKFEMTIKEMIFTLDKENYKKDYLDFNERFSKVNNNDLQISNDLKEILKVYEIYISKTDFNFPIKYSVNRTKNLGKIKFPNHHSIKRYHKKSKDN